MTYQPYLIAKYATGFDQELQPWLLPDDAFFEMFDGFVYRGVVNKRNGYKGYACGLKSTYCESRMVHNLANVNMTGTIDGSNRTFTLTATTPVRRGTFVVTGSNPAQTLTDNGVGGFTGNGTGTINYTTGAVSITFTSAPAVASTVRATYDYHPGNPVMGVMNYWAVDGTRTLVVADTQYVNKYDPNTDRLIDISPAGVYHGTPTNFWSWTNYQDASANPRLLFTNGFHTTQDLIQVYNGSTVTSYSLTPPSGVTNLSATQLFSIKGRLVLFGTIEDGTYFPKRIRISGFGASCDDFSSAAVGAGVIDIPDESNYNGADFNRDDLLFFMENSSWSLKYTNNDVIPFVLQKLDESRGSKAPFGVRTYLNRTMAASPRGFIIGDGYRVERMDNNVPTYAYDNIDNNNFNLCFAGFVDQDRDMYFIHPSPDQSGTVASDRILKINFEEDNYAVYKLPLSCMGNYVVGFTITWNDLTAANGIPDWNSLGEKYENWTSFSYSKGDPLAIGGGQHGEIWVLNALENQDNSQLIRNITYSGNFTYQMTTDFNNYQVGDYVYIDEVSGMTEINNKQGVVDSITTAGSVINVKFSSADIMPNSASYISGGTISRVIPFEVLTKKFNPFAEMGKKVRCGWMYFYVTVSDTYLLDIDNEPVPCQLQIDVITNDTTINTSPSASYKVDCSNLSTEIGDKKWFKMWINQTARFVQFRIKNTQAGANIQIHAMMPGFQPVGRLI